MRPYVEHVSTQPGFSWRLQDYRHGYSLFEWHYHQVYELVLHHNLTGQYFAGTCVAPLEQNNLTLFGPRLPHTTLHQPMAEGEAGLARVLWFSPGWISTIVEQLPEYQPVAALLRDSQQGALFSPALGALVKQQLDDFHRLSPMQQSCRILHLLVELAEQGPVKLLNPDRRQCGSPLDNDKEARRNEEKLERMLRYIDRHYSQPLSLDDLAAHLHISRSTVQRLFRKQFAQSFSEHLSQYRIGKACELLINSLQPIAVISQSVGFDNLSNFNRQFKKHKAMTPKGFRDMFRRD